MQFQKIDVLNVHSWNFSSIIKNKSKNKEKELDILTIYSKPELINDSILSLHKIYISGPIIASNSKQKTSNIYKIDNKKNWYSRYKNNEKYSRNGQSEFIIDLGEEIIFKSVSFIPQKLGIHSKLFTHYEFYAARTANQLRTEIRNHNYLSKNYINNTIHSTALIILEASKKARYVSFHPVNQNERSLYSESPPIPTHMAIYIDEERDKLWSLHRIDRSGWMATANSEQSLTLNMVEGAISLILDGDVNTIWHSKYSDASDGHDDRLSTNDPFQFTIDIGEDTAFKAFSYMPRQDYSTNGCFRHYEFYAAKTQDELISLIDSGNFLVNGDIDPSIKLSTLVIFYEQVKARYIALRSVNHDAYATCAEFNVFKYSSMLPQFSTMLLIDDENDNVWSQRKIIRDKWTATANSEQTTLESSEGPISNILDGGKLSIWHSKYNDGGYGGHDERDPPDFGPFIIKINLSKETEFKAFSYTPADASNGRFRHYEFYAAQTEDELDMMINDTRYLSKGDINYTSNLATLVVFNETIKAKYVALLSLNHDGYGTCAEFNLYLDVISPPTPTLSPTRSPTQSPIQFETQPISPTQSQAESSIQSVFLSSKDDSFDIYSSSNQIDSLKYSQSKNTEIFSNENVLTNEFSDSELNIEVISQTNSQANSINQNVKRDAKKKKFGNLSTILLISIMCFEFIIIILVVILIVILYKSCIHQNNEKLVELL